MKPLDTRRRQVLAAVGGVAAVVTLSDESRDFLLGSPQFTQRTYAATPEAQAEQKLEVAWYEEYNDQTVERHGNGSETNASKVLDPDTDPVYVPDAPGPVITITNVLPGDSGRLVMGLRPTGDVLVDLSASVTSNDNGQAEPEPPNGQGELADAIQARLWHDTGGIFGLGGCDGQFGDGDQEIASGSLTEVLDGLDRTIIDCLEAGARRCIGFDWSFPESSGNETQTDTIEFDLSFRARECP